MWLQESDVKWSTTIGPFNPTSPWVPVVPLLQVGGSFMFPPTITCYSGYASMKATLRQTHRHSQQPGQTQSQSVSEVFLQGSLGAPVGFLHQGKLNHVLKSGSASLLMDPGTEPSVNVRVPEVSGRASGGLFNFSHKRGECLARRKRKGLCWEGRMNAG